MALFLCCYSTLFCFSLKSFWIIPVKKKKKSPSHTPWKGRDRGLGFSSAKTGVNSKWLQVLKFHSSTVLCGTPVPDCPEKQGFTKRTFNQLEGKWLGDDLNTVSKSYFKAAPNWCLVISATNQEEMGLNSSSPASKQVCDEQLPPLPSTCLRKDPSPVILSLVL